MFVRKASRFANKDGPPRPSRTNVLAITASSLAGVHDDLEFEVQDGRRVARVRLPAEWDGAPALDRQVGLAVDNAITTPVTVGRGSTSAPQANWYHTWAPERYRRAVSTNLRLGDRAVAALRAAAAESGRSQQELLREAVDRYLGLEATQNSRDLALSKGLVKAPTPMRDVEPVIQLDPGMGTLDLLDRDADR